MSFFCFPHRSYLGKPAKPNPCHSAPKCTSKNNRKVSNYVHLTSILLQKKMIDFRAKKS